MATHQILGQGVPSRMRQSATYQDPDLDEISESPTTFHCHVDQVLVVCPLLLLIVQSALGRYGALWYLVWQDDRAYAQPTKC